MRAWCFVVGGARVHFGIAKSIRDETKCPAYDIFGIYDVIVEITSDSLDHIIAKTDQIETVVGVGTTNTYYAIHEGDSKKGITRKPFAFVMVDTRKEADTSIKNTLLTYGETIKADVVWGPYHVLVEADCDSIESLREFVIKIQRIPDVLKTAAFIVAPEEE